MAQIALRDLKNKPHNLTLKDGSVLRIKPRERVIVDEKLVSPVIFAEIQRGYLGYSKLPVAVSPKMTQTTTYKSPESQGGEDSAKAETETSNNTKSAKKNK